jgi:allophanate hydrolase subunit 2
MYRIGSEVLDFDQGRRGLQRKGVVQVAFVQLAEDLRNYVLAQNNEQPTLELAMTNKAKALLVRLR